MTPLLPIEECSSGDPLESFQCLTQAGVVTQWTDLSGNNMHATNSNTSLRPTVVANVMNGRPVVRLNGTDQFLSLPSGFDDFRSGMTVFAVTRATSKPAWSRVLEFSRGQFADNIILAASHVSSDVTGNVFVGDAQSSIVMSSGGRWPIGATRLLGTTIGTGSSPMLTVYVNGKLEAAATTAAPSNVLRTVNMIGKSAFPWAPMYGGDMAEIVVYPYTLSPAQRQAVEIEIRTRWAATAAPTITPVWPTGVTMAQAATFSATTTDADNDAVTVTWAFGDGTTATGASVSKTYGAAGTYTAVATAADAFGGTTTSSTTVTVADSPPGGLSGLALWLRADRGLTLSGSTVTSWRDQSVNSIVMSQIAGATTLVANSMNGNPVVRFAGAQALCTAGYDSRINTSAYTIFLVARGPSGYAVSSSSAEGDGRRGWLIGAELSLGGKWSNVFGNGTGFGGALGGWGMTSAAGLAGTAAILTTARHTGSVATIFQNGTLEQTATSPYSASIRGRACLGAQAYIHTGSGSQDLYTYFTGDIAEVLYYSRALSDVERTTVEADLRTRWGTP